MFKLDVFSDLVLCFCLQFHLLLLNDGKIYCGFFKLYGFSVNYKMHAEPKFFKQHKIHT